MKAYPSIPRDFREFDAYVFDKLDGSNIRCEWSRKQKWHKFGTRTQMIDQSSDKYGSAIPLFLSSIAEGVEKAAVDNRWDSVVAFSEFFGQSSIAGMHKEDEDKQIVLFDVSVYKYGILGPKLFLKYFGENPNIPTPNFIGQHKWNRSFINQVFKNEVEGVTFEGVVGKAGDGKNHNLIMRKAKTNNWIEKVKSIFNSEEAKRIIES